MKWITDILTENDGVTICPGRMALIFGASTFLALAIWAVYLKHDFDAQSFGLGYGSLLGGGLAGIWAKSKTDKS
jgi:hypothetical protein